MIKIQFLPTMSPVRKLLQKICFTAATIASWHIDLEFNVFCQWFNALEQLEKIMGLPVV